MLSTFVNACLISESSIAGVVIYKNQGHKLECHIIISTDLMTDSIAGSFG